MRRSTLNSLPRLADAMSMQSTTASADLVLGFSTIVDQGESGLIGGYLLLDARARPLEFHCTAPVLPNRAQKILYGPTLQGFVYGEQIALTLWKHSKLAVSLQITDRMEVASIRREWATPVVFVAGRQRLERPSTGGLSGASEVAIADFELPLSWHSIGVASHAEIAAVPAEYAVDIPRIQSLLAVRGDWDLLEPFHRIREALEEAMGRQAA